MTSLCNKAVYIFKEGCSLKMPKTMAETCRAFSVPNICQTCWLQTCFKLFPCLSTAFLRAEHVEGKQKICTRILGMSALFGRYMVIFTLWLFLPTEVRISCSHWTRGWFVLRKIHRKILSPLLRI